jgi:hypothetical protein
MSDILRISPLPPVEQIRSGLASVHRGIVDARSRVERLTRERDNEISALVDTEHRLRSMANAGARARRGRHLQAGEHEGARARDRDGPPLDVEHAPLARPLPFAPPRVPRDYAAETADSLRIYALTSTTSRPLDDAEAWRRIMGRG